jgi:hypothetical protein
MQLKVTHSQKKGMMGKHIFCSNMRAEYTPEEKERINKYDLGGEVIYSSTNAQKHAASVQASTNLGGVIMHSVLMGLNLNITIASLQKGQHIECNNLGELMDAEDAIVGACKNVKTWLTVAATFDGSENLVPI